MARIAMILQTLLSRPCHAGSQNAHRWRGKSENRDQFGRRKTTIGSDSMKNARFGVLARLSAAMEPQEPTKKDAFELTLKNAQQWQTGHPAFVAREDPSAGWAAAHKALGNLDTERS
jgi:hypothetical protein